MMTIITNKLTFITTMNLVSYLLSIYPCPVLSIEESFCAGVGFINRNDINNPRGLRSMGATSLFAHPLSTYWASNHRAESDPLGSLVVTFNKVMHAGQDLNGWLHLHLERKVPSGIDVPFVALAVWAITDKRDAVGEFVYLDGNSCDKARVKTKEVNHIPCSAVPIDSPMSPNMFIFTNSDDNKPVTEFNLLWRTNWNYCNKPTAFSFKFAFSPSTWKPYSDVQPFDLLEEKYSPIIYTTALFNPWFFGSASSVPDKTRLDCSKNIIDFRPRWLKSVPNIINKEHGLLHEAEPNYLTSRWRSETEEIKANVYRRQICKARGNGFADFGGRCTGRVLPLKNQAIYASLTQPPTCNNNDNNFGVGGGLQFDKNYFDHINDDRKTVVVLTCNCPSVPTVDEIITSADERSLETPDYMSDRLGCHGYQNVDYHRHGLCVESYAGFTAFGSRQFHSIATLCTTMVLIPVNSFLARYMKGALPVDHTTQSPRIPIRSWYITHIIFVVPISCLYITGLSAIEHQKGTIGVSQDIYAVIHRRAGFALMALFLFQCIFGFVRPLHQGCRRIFIVFHWVGGLIIRYGGTLLAILTYRIPASPTAFQSHLDDERFPYLYHHIPAMILLACLLIDFTFNVFLTRHILRFTHKRLEMITRPFFPVILPLPMDCYYLRTRDHDFVTEEDALLKKFLIAYIIACVFMYIFTLLFMLFYRVQSDLGFGPMTCTHDELGIYLSEGDADKQALQELHDLAEFCNN